MQLSKHWLKETSRGQISTLPFRAGSPLRQDQLTMLLSRWALQTSRKGSSTAPLGKDASPTLQFASISDCYMIWCYWEESGSMTFIAVLFKLLTAQAQLPQPLLTGQRPPPILLNLHWIFLVSKQPSWSGKDPKHNTTVQVTLIWRGIQLPLATLLLQAHCQVTEDNELCIVMLDPYRKHQPVRKLYDSCLFQSDSQFVANSVSFHCLLFKSTSLQRDTLGRHLLFILHYVRYQLKI